ncbi:SnoaL-like protein [Lacinutrix venerupis]|uniref:nuclear transport factor 2 family protein n=1 Tax=Lacinutrix venerupis TaxID=1486034 RepID=UPI000EB4DE70|nr:nuclear transport factor 2 family protein [Lacinutrix venerupis]RLJ63433.1 SnoaL-like protein [Lacinutrix venerupis]
MRIIIPFLAGLLLVSCKTEVKVNTDKDQTISIKEIETNINTTLDNWHKAATEANFDNYFNLMTDDGVFIGTDATENWQNDAFKSFSKPYFDKGKAWSFTTVDRNIYVYDNHKIAWFDELLDTQMKLCRGSGILKLENNQWKVAHYVLSITIPNENVTEVVKLKTSFDSVYIKKLKLK